MRVGEQFVVHHHKRSGLNEFGSLVVAAHEVLFFGGVMFDHQLMAFGIVVALHFDDRIIGVGDRRAGVCAH